MNKYRSCPKTLPQELCQSQLYNIAFCQGGVYKALAARATSSALVSIQVTMTHDSTPHRVLKISELTRHIASQLVLIDSRRSAVNLACACRCLEEPVLSILWERQWSLITLLGVLPKETWEFKHLELGGKVVRSFNSPPE